MDDPVADILMQRAAMDRGVAAAAAVVLSLLAHGALSALAVWAAWHHTAPQTPSIMTIKFAKMPQVAAPVATTVAAAPPKAAAPALKAVEAPKPVAKPVAASPFGKSTKKATPIPAAPAPTAATTTAPATSTQPQVAVGATGVTGLEGGDFPYTLYIDRMRTLIGTRWLRPQATSGESAIVYFIIDRDGTIRDAKLESQSGNGTFDRAALRAVLESSPLPPLPFGYSGTYLGVHLNFR